MPIVKMSINDIEPVVAIERASFPNPWSTQCFMDELACPTAHAFVRKDRTAAGESVSAYMCLRNIFDEIHILKIAVKPDNRKRGIAAGLIRHCLDQVAMTEAVAVLEVRPSNGAGLALYRKLGFIQAGVRPRYYTDTGEDAIIMYKHITQGGLHDHQAWN